MLQMYALLLLHAPDLRYGFRNRKPYNIALRSDIFWPVRTLFMGQLSVLDRTY